MSELQRGDVVRVRATGARNNLVVLTNISRSKFVVGILVHTAAEFATDMDIVLSQGVSPLPFPMVLCCDLYGTFLRTQIDRRLANVGPLPTSHILFSAQDAAEMLGGFCGLPLSGVSDPRWTEKERLLSEELHPLTRPFWQGFKW